MNKTIKIMSIVSLTALSAHLTSANNEVSLLQQINVRFEAAAKAFKSGENSEIKLINSGDTNINNSNGDTKDMPDTNNTDTFMSAGKDMNEMICFDEKTGMVMTAATPSLLNTPFDASLKEKVMGALNAEGKAEIHYDANVANPNDSKNTLQEKMILVAWNEMALIGKKVSGMVCTISAPAP